ncbi:MAG: hypothetical protein RL026_2431 [Pseudomonadota bacterium]
MDRSRKGAAFLGAAALLVFSAAGCAPQAPDWTARRDAFIEAEFVAEPAFAVYQGRHEFDGRIGDFSAAGLQARIAQLRAAREAFQSVEAADLTPEQRFERDYLLQLIDGNLFWIAEARQPWTNPVSYLEAIDPSPYLEREYAPVAERLSAYLKFLAAIPPVLQSAEQNLELPLVQSQLQRASSGFAGLADFLEGDAIAIFAGVQDAARQAELKAASSTTASALRAHVAWLEEQRPQATQAFALGAERFAAMLRATEGVTTPLAELKKAGETDLERNLQALREACAEFAPGATPADCISKVRARKAEGGPVQGARRQLEELRAFLVERDIVSIPGTEAALVAESPPHQRANSAYINIPGPYEKGLASVYYISPPDPSWSAAEQDAYVPGEADLLFTSAHEVWPGHFLQFLHSNRAASPVGRLFVGYAFAEGWAHYTEEMMLEKGLRGRSAEARVGQLSNALLRNARFLSAIGLHTEGMTLAQSEQLFVDKAFQDVGTARQQAARGTYDPAYLNYTLGKLMIRKLRDDWSATRGGEAAWKAFHDQFLSYGGPPIPLVRKAMLGEGDTGSLL